MVRMGVKVRGREVAVIENRVDVLVGVLVQGGECIGFVVLGGMRRRREDEVLR